MKHAHKLKTQKAFTLSEVMLVLSVIGVIAALTIPSLVNSIDQTMQRVKAQKFMSTMSNVVQMIMAKNDLDSDLKNLGIFEGADNDTAVAKEILKHLNGARDCGENDVLNCFPQKTYKNKTGSICLDFQPGYNYSIVTADGMPVAIDEGSNNGPDIFIYVYADINGSKLPNRCGEDLFYFSVLRNGKVQSDDYLKVISRGQ